MITENEKKLFQQLFRLGVDFSDESLLENASPEVLGHLFFNRMQGIAYHQLKVGNLLNKVSREFRNSLKVAYEHNVELNEDYKLCVNYVANILKNSNCQYAMLKGAFLCSYYPIGCRTSNDIDLLVLPKDITEIGNLLKEAGFSQGKIENGVFVPATRNEIIQSKMLRGETVPYVKEVNLPSMKYLEIDINYSLDYKNGTEDLVEDLLAKAEEVSLGDFSVTTLSQFDFFIHLCMHLYKEATTYPWVAMNRDMTLYKYEDIYYVLSRMAYGDIANIFERAATLGLDKICAFAILQTNELIGLDPYLVVMATMVLENDLDFLHRVVDPGVKKIYIYENKNIYDRFFCNQRKMLLREVTDDETSAYETTST